MDINSIYFQMDTNMANAYIEGKQSYYGGQYRYENPHEEGTELYTWWNCGFSDAIAEDVE